MNAIKTFLASACCRKTSADSVLCAKFEQNNYLQGKKKTNFIAKKYTDRQQVDIAFRPWFHTIAVSILVPSSAYLCVSALLKTIVSYHCVGFAIIVPKEW